jgi:hypothetical protein
MVQLIQKDSKAGPGTLSFFPAPYPDECYYSILCRFMVHSGMPSTAQALKTLFGRIITPSSTVLMPYMSSRVPEWLSSETGISEDTFIRNHTAYHYISISFWKHEREAVREQMRAGEAKGYRNRYRRSMAPALRYCPACAYEEKVKYGEMYWHRIHQLNGISCCVKHGIQLADSGTDLKKMKRSLVPASFVLQEIYRNTLCGISEKMLPESEEILKKHRQLQRDVIWLMQHGEEMGGLEGITGRYGKELTAQGWADGKNGRVTDMPRLIKDLREYFGSGYLNSLGLERYEFLEWKSVPVIVAKFLSPLEHVLMMEYLCGSARKFSKVPV